jgi:hypothetical protein
MKIIPLGIVAQSAIFEFQAVIGSIQVEAQSKTSVQVSITVPFCELHKVVSTCGRDGIRTRDM